MLRLLGNVPQQEWSGGGGGYKMEQNMTTKYASELQQDPIILFLG